MIALLAMTFEQLNAAASNSVQNLLDSVFEVTGFRTSAQVSCEYIGEVNALTGFITRKQRKKEMVPWRAQLAFLFKAQLGESVAHLFVQGRRDHVLDRGVPFPRASLAALSATCLVSKVKINI